MKSSKMLNLAVSVVAVAMMFSSCASNKAVSNDVVQQSQEQAYQITNLVGTPLDYSDKTNWMAQEQNPTHEADLVYIYPTVSTKSPDGNGISGYDENYKNAAQCAFKVSGSVFTSYTNVYAPYYRQVSLDKAMQCKTQDEYKNFAKETVVRTDVYAALDYYFKNLNNGRPFIFAGHSQGSAIIQIILADYMKAHPEYLKQMIAAYVIGFSITKDYLKENPQVKFAQGETDTNVIVSYNTEGPDAKLPNFVVAEGSVSINPINWKLDETLATVDQNKGSIVTKMDFNRLLNPTEEDLSNNNLSKIENGYGDAKVELKRGSVICTTEKNYVASTPENSFFGDKSLHMYDYSLYAGNLKENGKKRIDAFLGHEAK